VLFASLVAVAGATSNADLNQQLGTPEKARSTAAQLVSAIESR
jgi:hypothetical protein